MDAKNTIRDVFFYIYRRGYPGHKEACYLIQEYLNTNFKLGTKRVFFTLAVLVGHRFDVNSKIEDMYSLATQYVNYLYDKGVKFDSLTKEEKFIEIYKFPVKNNVNIDKYINPSNINMSFLVKNSVEDNWPDMLKTGLQYEDKWPPKPPAMFVQTHTCHHRRIQIATMLADAKEKADILEYGDVLNILEDRISKGVLLYPCCERNDGRIMIKPSGHCHDVYAYGVNVMTEILYS